MAPRVLGAAAVVGVLAAALGAPVPVHSAKPRPVVLWHGMGDTCCYPFSMGAVKEAIEKAIPGIFVYSIEIGDSITADEIHGFIGNVNDQIKQTHEKLSAVPELKDGFNAVGFSQGGQFMRGYVERYQHVGPAVHNLVSMGGQHFGVTEIPDCTTPTEEICKMVLDVLQLGVYNSFVQEEVVQAQYFRDPLEYQTYFEVSKFLADINNEMANAPKNHLYKKNLMTLNHFALFMFTEDTVVVPRESEVSVFGLCVWAAFLSAVLCPNARSRKRSGSGHMHPGLCRSLFPFRISSCGLRTGLESEA
jgi:palmitoyl-protein thioesterase